MLFLVLHAQATFRESIRKCNLRTAHLCVVYSSTYLSKSGWESET